jgi:hypothetical protein
MWWIHQAHRGGLFQPGQMTTPYFYSVVGRIHPDRDKLKLLDTKEYFHGQPQRSHTLVEYDFEQDTLYCSSPWPLGGKAACLNGSHQYAGPITFFPDSACRQWIRFEADFIVESREWDLWKYAQWIVQFNKDGNVIKTNFIRIQRLIPTDYTSTHLFFDVQVPDTPFDKCMMTIWNGDSPQTLLIDNLKISCFVE